MRVPLVVVCGPTASGKTRLGVEICRKFNGEVISADSMQIYKGMNIATAKPELDERKGIPHHLIDILEPSGSFSVADFKRLADECIADIYSRSKLPVMVGGTGLYIQSVTENILYTEESGSKEIRRELEQRAKINGIENIFEELKKVDPEQAQRLSLNDSKRIIRALEVYYETGFTASENNARSKQASYYDTIFIGLDARDRQVLYERINERVDMMLNKGLLDEAKDFFKAYPGETARQAIGYKELKAYIDEEVSLDEAAQKLKQATRRYAKRQLTWFRNKAKVNWFYIDEYSSFDLLFKDVCDVLNLKL